MAKKIREAEKIYSIIAYNVNNLFEFSKLHKLTNVEIRCDIIIKKMNDHTKVNNLYLDTLKKDLYADIEVIEFDCITHRDYIPPNNSPSYKVAYSINKLDEHIFGGIMRKKSMQPIKIAFDNDYYTMMNKITKNILPNLHDLSSKDFSNILDNSTSVMMLSIFRAMHNIVLEANKQYIKKIDQQIYGKFDDNVWEEIVAYDKLFILKNGRGYKSDFKVIGDAFSHGDYTINNDGSISIEPDTNEYITKKITYSQNEIVSMLFAQYRKFVDFFPALIIIETIINNNTYYMNDIE